MDLGGFTGILLLTYGFFTLTKGECVSYVNEWETVPCNEQYNPDNCDFEKLARITVEDYERCGPALLSVNMRNIFLGASGRRITYNENQAAFKRIAIVPKVLRDLSQNSLETTVLGQKVAFPIGLSPVAHQKFAHPEGEIATVRAISDMETIMILSSMATTTLEAVAANNECSHLWMQTYIFQNRTLTVNLVQRAEKNGYEAIVLSADSPISAILSCNARDVIPDDFRPANVATGSNDVPSAFDITFKDIKWLTSITKLPIVVKGILSGGDAVKAFAAGASAILVSNHGGRQMDSAPATIDALQDVVEAVKELYPDKEVYMDCGVRDGHDVYKALARGAKFVFVGRPIVWGLAKGGEKGVKHIMRILKSDFNETMLLAGASSPSKITKDTTKPISSCCCI